MTAAAIAKPETTSSRSSDVPGPVFIVGCGSSGTHLLASILDGHSQIGCGPELWVFNHKAFFWPFKKVRDSSARWLENGLLSEWPQNQQAFCTNVEAYGHTSASILELAQRSETHREFIDGFYRPFLKSRGKVVWVEKTLSNYRCFDQLLVMYPDARIIHMARHGLDTMVSLGKRGMTPFQAASRWVFDNAGVLAWKDDPRYTLVRYEDLVRNTEAVAKRLCAHLGVDFQPAMLDGSNAESRSYWEKFAEGNYHKTWQTRPDAGVTDASIDRHLRELPEPAEAVFWGVRLTAHARRVLHTPVRSGEEVMRMLEYPCVPQRALPSVGLGSQAQLVFSCARRLWREIARNRRWYWPCATLGRAHPLPNTEF